MRNESFEDFDEDFDEEDEEDEGVRAVKTNLLEEEAIGEFFFSKFFFFFFSIFCLLGFCV